MISINTNLGSLIVQSSLNKSTNALNTAIERMTTGFKINGAKDNAAGYSISERMSSQISSYEVAEDNVSTGLNIVETASSTLAIIEDRLARLRMLQEQTMNGTYGTESLEAINKECNSLVDEINRLYYSTDYNGIRLFIDTTDVNDEPQYQELNANRDTTFEELGVTSYGFSVYDSGNSLLDDITMSADDTISDFFGRLAAYDISGEITGGVITLSSSNGNYIAGELVNEMGISVNDVTYIEYSSQSSSSPVTYEKTTTADISTTFATLGITSGSDIVITDEFQNVLGTVTVGASDTIESLFNALSAYDIDGEIKNGVITLESPSGNYASGNLLTSLGIGVQTSPAITLTTTATLSSTISDYYSGSSYNITIVNQETGGEDVITLDSNSTFNDFKSALNGHNMELGITDGVMTISSSNKYLYAKGDMLDTFGISETPNGTYTVTTVNSMTSSTKMTYTVMTTNTVTQTVTGGTFLQSVTPIDTTGMQSVSAVNLQSLVDSGVTEGTFAIRTTSDLDSIANQIDAIDSASFTFVMANNIDYGGGSWTPILGFRGVFDGNGFIISNVNSSSGGLFRSMGSRSTVKNLGLENIEVTDETQYGSVGGLCDSNSGVISNCYVLGGSIYGDWVVGGLVGTMSYGTITNCYTSVTVTSSVAGDTAMYAGGIVGIAGNYGHSVIENCYSASNIIDGIDIGGIVGNSEAYDLYISNCQFSGTISNMNSDYVNAGGILGRAQTGHLHLELINCLVEGSIRVSGANSTSAGLIGSAYVVSTGSGSGATYTAAIRKCYVRAGGTYDYGLIGSYSTDNQSSSGTVLEIEDSGVSNGKSLYDSSNSFISSDGRWSSSYTPVFNYYTTSALTTVVQTGTSVIDATSGVALSTLGINSGALMLMVNGVSTQLQYSSGYTLQDFINSLGTYGITASISGGKLTIGQNRNAYIISDSGNLAQKAGLDISNAYNVSTDTLYTNTSSNELSITQVKVPGTNTPSNTQDYISTHTLSESTTLSDINLGGNYQVKINGKDVNISINSSDTLGDFIAKLRNIGIEANVNNGIFTLRGDGESGILASALLSALNLGQIAYTEGVRKVNTESGQMTYLYELPWLNLDEIYAPGSFVLQVGITSDESSQIAIGTAFKLSPTEALRGIGLYNEDYLSAIDKMQKEISLKQTELGAAQNRLESALDEISVHYENLVSSRSTLRDTDVAEVSSEYIRNQILQQASATLLATANQTPSIALQLL